MYMAQINQGQAEWFMSGAVYSSIMALESTEGNPVIQPLYTVAPYGTLFGRPINIVPCMRGANGQAGTISFTDWGNAFIIGTKGGVRMQSSIHLYFNTDEEVYRWVLRIAGGPTKATTLTLADGRVVASAVHGFDS
jgi:HK97 family phage major capsid protein